MSRTYAHQNSLPQLPIPSLEQSKANLLTALKPLLTREQLVASQQHIDEFCAESGAGVKLQKKLQQLANTHTDSWLKSFWDEAYLTGRTPLHIATNYVLQLDKKLWCDKLNSAQLAARLIQAAAIFYKNLKQEKIAPECVRGIALDMSQYAGFMASKRIPQQQQDVMYRAHLQGKALHVCVALRGHIFSLQATDEQGRPIARELIESALKNLLLTTMDKGADVGLHTIAEREQAANFYQRLEKSSINAQCLQQINDALFLLVLDETSENEQQAVHNLLLDGHNKWFDKPLQLVLGLDASLGVNIEHTEIDGTTCLAIIDLLLEQALANTEPEVTAQKLMPPQRLAWQLDSQLNSELVVLQQQNTKIINNYWLHTENFTSFGAEQIKQLGFSPDAFFHMALQVAQLQTFGQMRSTYESVAMRGYYQGRTECLRPSNAENLALATAIQQQANEQDIYQLMQQAAQAHSTRMRLAQQGQGFERHLYGLHQVYERHGDSLGIRQLPRIFADPGYQLLSHDFISTSNMTSTLVHSCAFAPVTDDGFGIFYLLLNDKISINLSSYWRNKEQAQQLVANILLAFEQLRCAAVNGS